MHFPINNRCGALCERCELVFCSEIIIYVQFALAATARFFFSVGNISVGYGNLISDFPFRSVDIILMYLRRCGRLHNDKLLWWQYFYFVPCFVLRVKFSVNQLTWQRAVVQQWPWRSSTGQSSLRFYAQAKLPFELTRKLPCSERSETDTTHEISFQFSHFYSYSNKNHLG